MPTDPLDLLDASELREVVREERRDRDEWKETYEALVSIMDEYIPMVEAQWKKLYTTLAAMPDQFEVELRERRQLLDYAKQMADELVRKQENS